MATARRAEPAARALHVAEPPPLFTQRPLAVVDASVIAALLFAEPDQAVAERTLAACQPVAPDLLAYELGNVAVDKLRCGHAEAAVRAGLADFEALDITLHPIGAVPAFDMAARYGLTAYDAAYLVLAAQLRCALFTFDTRLADAARKHFGTAA